MNVHIYVVDSSGKIICPGLPFFLVELHKGEDLGSFATDRHSDKHLSSPFGMYGILLISMADWSTSEPWSYTLLWQPRQTICSASFCPLSVVCRNILCRIIALWGVPSSHLGYSSKKSLMLIWHSALRIEVSFSSANSQAAQVLWTQSPYLNDNRVV